MKDKETYTYITSSVITAIVTKTSIAPITRVKVLQQIQSYHSSTHYNNIFSSFKYIYNQEGVRGFYKGNTANIYKSIPNYCLKFPLNDLYIHKIIKDKNYKTVKELPFQELLQAGLFTGVMQTSCAYPLDLIRTRVTQDKNMLEQKMTIGKCLIETVKQEGITALYKGFTPAITTTPIYIGLQLSTFQYLKNQDHILSNTLLAGATAGVLSQSIMYPGDTIKRQMQINGMNKNTQYNSVRECIMNIYKKHGIQGFYKGIMLNSVKSIPEIAIKFSIYEYVKQNVSF